jgi:hypothetical protein
VGRGAAQIDVGLLATPDRSNDLGDESLVEEVVEQQGVVHVSLRDVVFADGSTDAVASRIPLTGGISSEGAAKRAAGSDAGLGRLGT